MPHYGLYRGTVIDNVDPQKSSRVRIRLAGLAGGGAETWALPCLRPVGGDGGPPVLPRVGSTAWVMFEGGDVNFPVWLGVLP